MIKLIGGACAGVELEHDHRFVHGTKIVFPSAGSYLLYELEGLDERAERAIFQRPISPIEVHEIEAGTRVKDAGTISFDEL